MSKSKFIDMTYGARLQMALDASKKTRKQLADHLETSPQRIGIIITWAGEEERRLTTLAHLRAAQYLNVDALWLACGEGEMRPAQPKTDSLGQQLADLFDQLPDEKSIRSEVFVQCYQVIAPVVQRIGAKPSHMQDVHIHPRKLGV
jgi:hypothetical protein